MVQVPEIQLDKSCNDSAVPIMQVISREGVC